MIDEPQGRRLGRFVFDRSRWRRRVWFLGSLHTYCLTIRLEVVDRKNL